MQPDPAPGAVHKTCTSVFGTDDVWVMALGQRSLKRFSESPNNWKLPAVSGVVSIFGSAGSAVSKNPANFCTAYCERHPCRVTVNACEKFDNWISLANVTFLSRGKGLTDAMSDALKEAPRVLVANRLETKSCRILSLTYRTKYDMT